MNDFPNPAPAPYMGGLPHAITIFVSHDERLRTLRALKRIHPDRRTALLAALGIRRADEPDAQARKPSDPRP